MRNPPSRRLLGRALTLSLAAALGTALGTGLSAPRSAAASPQRSAQKDPDLSAWCKDLDAALLDPKLREEDRAATKWLVGYELPAAPASVTWVGPAPSADAQFRGKVVVLANTPASGKGRTAFKKLQAALEPLAKDAGFVLVALHTPDGAKSAAAKAERTPWGCSLAIDEDGAWCDTLGLYREPVTIIIDKRGNVRAAGLTPEGASKAATTLLAEPFNDKDDKPTTRAPASTPAPQDVTFPQFDAASMPMLGKEAPPMAVSEWFRRPVGDAAGKVVVLDFWEPWCAPCRAAIPHMNEMQDGYPKDLVCVGVSGMDDDAFLADFRKFNLKEDQFHYGLALSPAKSMHGALGVRAYPTVFVVSGDWKVRWQGHPMALTDQVLRPIVEANRTMYAGAAAAAGDGPNRKQSWSRTRK